MKLILVFLFVVVPSLLPAAPVKLIFDTDMGNDIDDLMALCMIHNLQKRGACELLAVTVTKDHPQAAAFVDAVNTLYGYPDTPIGVVRNGAAKEPGKFNLLADKHPHDLKSGTDAPEACALIKDVLAKQPDASVVIVQVGFFTNLARLTDDASANALITKKVKFLCLMAGAFQTVNFDTRHLEYNVKLDVPAAQKLATQWPTPMIWSGFEIGVAAAFPHISIEEDLNYIPNHPLKEGYYLYNPPPHDRPTWDPTAVLYAIYPDRGYFDLSPPGNIIVENDSATLFRPVKKGTGKHRFLIMSPEQASRVREAIVQLSVEPPQAKK
ncbi:MAG: nucleoside hydrolase [Verrucomicrobiaceae bacterium]|nr:nucleoside hydrolase [Verrucomicrobiaceae bacterium]